MYMFKAILEIVLSLTLCALIFVIFWVGLDVLVELARNYSN